MRAIIVASLLALVVVAASLALRLALEARDPVAMMAIARPARHSFEKMFTMRS